MIKLGRGWARLLRRYEADHQNAVNRALHKVGIPMIAASLPLGVSVIGLPLAAPLFSVGWTFQLVGHAFEGKRPTFVSDRRALIAGLLWWAHEVGLPIALPDETSDQRTPDHGMEAAS